MASEERDLVITLEDGLLILRFNRPKRKNALNGEMMSDFKNALLKAGSDPDTKIVVITGTGDYFTSGNDLGNFTQGTGLESTSKNYDTTTDEGKIAMLREKGVNNFEELVKIIIECPKPIIAVVNGPAVGLGVTMLPLLDVVYASDKATFHTPFVKLAQSPEACSSYLFPRIMGPGKAAEMLLFSRKITALDAYQHGLVTEMFRHENLHEVWPRIKKWSKLPPNSMMNAKSLLTGHNKETLLKVNHLECDRLALQFTKDEFTTALMAFFNRKSKL